MLSNKLISFYLLPFTLCANIYFHFEYILYYMIANIFYLQ